MTTDHMFRALNLTHLSASSINRWTGDRGAWVAHYIFGIKGGVGPAAWRGSAVEDGLTAHVTGAGIDPLDYAMRTFERDAQGDMDEPVEKERKLVGPMLEQAVGRWQEAALGRPVTQQIRVEAWLDGIAVPLIGYADFVLDGYCVDLKTTKALPSSPKHDHLLQAAGYALARRETKAALLYVTGKKSAFYEVDHLQIGAAVEDLSRRARGLQNTLRAAWRAAGGDAERARLVLAEMCPPNLDSFYWSAAEFTRAQAAIEAWQ